MTGEVSNTYEHSDNEALETGEAVMRYIYEGDVTGLPLEFRGVKVFGAIHALRENDEVLYGESTQLSEAQQARLEEIEEDVTQSVAKDLQYYPFGHKRNQYVDRYDYNARQRAGALNGWGIQERKTAGHRSSHAGQIVTPALVEVKPS